MNDVRRRSGVLVRLSDVAWRFLVIALAVYLVVLLLVRIRVVVLAVFGALLLAAVLSVPVEWLRRVGVPNAVAVALAYVGFLALLTIAVTQAAGPVVDEFSGFGETISQGVDDIEEWLTTGPLDLSEDQIEEYRARIGDAAGEFLSSSGSGLLAGAAAAAEGVAGVILALVLSIFFVKDGRNLHEWVLDHLPQDRRSVLDECTVEAWRALGGFLRGAALLGIVEAIAISLALLLVGAKLILPVALLTFLAAFVPIAGAIVAGILAVLVAFVSGGAADAGIVAIVAITVQQLDNDLLAPLIYGRFVQLHPVVILLTVAAGGALGGLSGAFLAVPSAASASAVLTVLWQRGNHSPAELEPAG